MNEIDSLTRGGFIDGVRRADGSVDLNDPELREVLSDGGIDVDRLEQITSKDGIIDSEREASVLFSAVDRLDQDGSSHSIRIHDGVTLTPPGQILSALNHHVARRRAHLPFDRRRFTDELGRGRGSVDLATLRAEVLEGLERRVGVDRLEQIAGPDYLISGRELGALYDALGANSDGLAPNDELLTELRIHADQNRHTPRYQRPGAAAEPQRRLTAAEDAVHHDESWFQPLTLNVQHVFQFSLVDSKDIAVIRREGKTKCYQAAVRQADDYNRARFGSDAPRLQSSAQAIQVAYAEDGDGRLKVDESRAAAALIYIMETLEAGLPVVVGVSYADKEINTDRLTDHFVTVIGRGYESGRPYFEFLDPGTSRRRPFRLYIDQSTGMLFRDGSRRTPYVDSADYQVTQVRTYDRIPGASE
ncbi:MAG: hypothetical protein AAFU77_09250 [Myxococcota bacterium]